MKVDFPLKYLIYEKLSHLSSLRTKTNRPQSSPDGVVVSGRRVPVQLPRGTSATLLTSSGLMVPLMSMGSGWIFSRSSLMTVSSTWSPSVLFFPLKVSQELQKASGLAASDSFSQLSSTVCSSVSSQPEK